jgi:hypothetical protein
MNAISCPLSLITENTGILASACVDYLHEMDDVMDDVRLVCRRIRAGGCGLAS